MIIIVNNAIKEFCIYGDPMIEFDDVMLLLKRKFGESNITWYRATTESLAEDLVTEEKRGNKRAVLAEWLQIYQQGGARVDCVQYKRREVPNAGQFLRQRCWWA